MNRKLIAAAVAGAVSAPMPALAQTGDVLVYGRINTAIEFIGRNYDGGATAPSTDSIDVSTIGGSRGSSIGIRYDNDLNPELKVHARYEFSTVSDREASDDGDALDDVRIATAGVSGNFGRVDVGNQWSAYYNSVGTLVSPTYTVGALIYSDIGGGPLRSSNTIKYSNAFGPFDLEFDLRLREDTSDGGPGTKQTEELSGEGFGFGLTFYPLERLTVAMAYDNEEVGDDIAGFSGAEAERLGLAFSYQAPRAKVTFGWQQLDHEARANEQSSYFLNAQGNLDEQTRWLAGYALGEHFVNAEVTSLNPAGLSEHRRDSEQFMVGVYRDMRYGFTLYYEGAQSDNSSGPASGPYVGQSYQQVQHLFGLRLDF